MTTALGNVSSSTDSKGITTITFYHPAQNSMPADLLMRLAELILGAGADPQTRVVILQSSGDRTFCAGASFDELLQIKDEQAGAKFFSGFADVINACRKIPKIVIVRVQGKAVGGGVGLAAAGDYCLATEAAAIKLSELTIGIGPLVISPPVVRKIGLSAFSKLTIRATEFQSAQWAMEHGLYNDVYPDIETLDDEVSQLAEKLASYNPDALTALKQILWENTDDWDEILATRAATSGTLVLSPFTQQALNDFLENRKKP